MKRQWRNDMSQQQKDKLSAINKGKKHSQQTKDKIAKSMEDYWRKLPYKPATSTSGGDWSSDDSWRKLLK